MLKGLAGTKRFLSDVKFDIVIAFYLLLKYVFLKPRSRMWSGMFVVANASLHWSSLVWQCSQFALDLASCAQSLEFCSCFLWHSLYVLRALGVLQYCLSVSTFYI